MTDFQPLPQSFYAPSAAKVAPALLGHFLIRRTTNGFCGGAIVETEAYLTDDPACHGFGRETPRNRVLYGPPGRAYVYFIYGNHWCFNTVCAPPGVAEAVLVRAIEPLFGKDWMEAARPGRSEVNLSNGPGKFCQAMKIDRAFDGADLSDPHSPIVVARNPRRAQYCRERGPLITTVRVGITKASDLPLRFYLAGSHFVSRRSQQAEKHVKTERKKRRAPDRSEDHGSGASDGKPGISRSARKPEGVPAKRPK
jgi:DNA-3-methyladenine glycosylase